ETLSSITYVRRCRIYDKKIGKEIKMSYLNKGCAFYAHPLLSGHSMPTKTPGDNLYVVTSVTSP
ncbi:hypothetical protein, partial [Clostridium sp.]|uniref:hypothetical protein n=1 Tax=Clostridium sp. TaxID=1506 RepID=UPI002609F310